MHVLSNRVAWTAIFALLAGLLAIAAPASAGAPGTFYVSLDDDSFNPGPDQSADCTDQDPGTDCSIRDAVHLGNGSPSTDGVDEINFLFDGPTTITIDGSGFQGSPDARISSLDVLTNTVINGEDVTIENIGIPVGAAAFTGDSCFPNTFNGGFNWEEGGIFTVGEGCDFNGNDFTGADDPVTLTVNGLTVTGGERAFGGGYLVHRGNTLILAEAAVVVSNFAYSGGGGVFLKDEAALETSGGVQIIENEAGFGDIWTGFGGGAGGGIGADYESTVELADSFVSDNTAAREGGGIAANGALTIAGSEVDGNSSGNGNVIPPWAIPLDTFDGLFGRARGAGIASGEVYFDDQLFCGGICFAGLETPTSLTITDSSVSDNTLLGGNGGGLSVVFAESLSVTDSTIARNGNPEEMSEEGGINGGTIIGGGILSFQTPTTISGSDVTDNRAMLAGGGVALESFPLLKRFAGGEILQPVQPDSLITTSTLQGNVLSGIDFQNGPEFTGGEFSPRIGAGLSVVGGFPPEEIPRDNAFTAGEVQELPDYAVGVYNSTFDGNVGPNGSAIAVCDLSFFCPNSVDNSFIFNGVGEGPEPELPGVDLSLGHVTIVDNEIDELGVQPTAHGILTLGQPDVTVWNTLIQDATGDGTTGAACAGVDFAETPAFQQVDEASVLSWGGNSAGDETCNFTATGDVENQTDDALLANPAGAFVRPLPEGHSAIDAGIDTPVAPAPDATSELMELDCTVDFPDQVGTVRPVEEACDRGAVEFQPEPVIPDPVDPTDPPNPGPGDPDMPDRVGGPTRLETAVLGSQSAFGDSSTDTVVLARSDLFPDAQAGAPLAVELDGPLLLTQPNVLSTPTQAEIERVTGGSGTIILLGGEDAIESQVDDRLKELGYDTVRYGGANRFATAVSVATEGLGTPDNVLLADGGDFHPSIVAGAAAVVAGDSDFAQDGDQVDAAVLLTSGSDMAPETADYLDSATQTITTIGAAAAAAYPAGNSVGADAVDDPSLSVIVADTYFDGPVAVGIATTADFADALSGSSVVGNPRLGPGPMLFSEPDGLPGVVSRYLMANTDTIERTLLMGGTAALSAQVEADVEAALGGG